MGAYSAVCLLWLYIWLRCLAPPYYGLAWLSLNVGHCGDWSSSCELWAYLRRSAISAELRLGLRCRSSIVPTWLAWPLPRMTGRPGPLLGRATGPTVSLIHPILLTHPTPMLMLLLLFMLNCSCSIAHALLLMLILMFMIILLASLVIMSLFHSHLNCTHNCTSLLLSF